MLIAINDVRTIKESVYGDDCKVLKYTKRQLSLLPFYFTATKSGLNCISKQSYLMLFNTLYFVSLPVVQVKPKNNFSEAVSACLWQALITNLVSEKKQVVFRFTTKLEIEDSTRSLIARFTSEDWL